jgi:hypothetical protein
MPRIVLQSGAAKRRAVKERNEYSDSEHLLCLL